MKTRTKYLAVLAAIFIFSVIMGCGGGGSTGATPSTEGTSGTVSSASFRILVTDAPFSFNSVKSAIVDVQRIELHQVLEDAFVTLAEFPEGRELDLVQLRNGVVETLFEGNPPPGSYDEVRIIVHARQIVIDDQGAERTFIDFKVPSGPETGIKIFIEPAINVATNLSTDLVLDFDLSRSFVVQGNPATPAGIKGFIFKPVVRAVNSTVAGMLTFLVRSDNGTEDAADDLPLNGVAFTLTDGLGAVVASGSSGDKPEDATVEGYVFHPAIPEGDYSLSLTAAGYEPYEAPVTISAGNLTDLGVITMARTPGMITGSVTTQITPLDPDTLLVFAVPEATLEAGGESAVTDNGGNYQLTNLPVGDHVVTVSKIGYETLMGSGTAAPVSDPPVTSDFTLAPINGDLTGTVTDGLAAAVADAAIRATMEFAGTIYTVKETTTDAAGSYSLSLPTGSYDIVAEKGTSSVSVSIDMVGGETPLTQDLTLP